MTISTWVIIPLKHLSEGKTSLKEVLNRKERSELMLRMLEDVLAAIAPIKSATAIVVSPDEKVLSFVQSKEAKTIAEPDVGLNDALRIAIEKAKEEKVKEILILPADIPMIRPKNIEKIMNMASGKRDVVIAPSEEKGTNALLLRPPDVMNIKFGGKSFHKHVKESQKVGILPHIYRSKNIEVDIDAPSDLIQLELRGVGTASHDFLSSLKV